jgi:hypothetical protein
MKVLSFVTACTYPFSQQCFRIFALDGEWKNQQNYDEEVHQSY